VRGHVAGRAGVGVVAPGAADLFRALEDREGVDARAQELDRGADPGEAGADDRDRELAVARRGRLAQSGRAGCAAAQRPAR